jgi:ABC-type Zn uptake system ZnuABC Zn-binding protein ZnuA
MRTVFYNRIGLEVKTTIGKSTMKRMVFFLLSFSILAVVIAGCQAAPAATQPPSSLHVIAIESFLADITRNVAGDRAQVDSLIPIGVDPHVFEPVPQDIVRLSQAQVIVANGAGLETWLQRFYTDSGDKALQIDASAGLTPRTAGVSESSGAGSSNIDPHFWLDPINVIRYVENIRDGLTQADPQGKAIYAQNAAAYIAQLQDLDAWIRAQVVTIPTERRLLVTNHEDFGYFADRYGFHILGTIIPSFSTDSSPSPQQLARLVDNIKASHAPAVFLEAGVNPQLADEIARETGVKVVTGLLTHSVTAPGGPAPTYIDMIKYDVNAIVTALK